MFAFYSAAQKQLSELKSKLKEVTAPSQRERLLSKINEQVYYYI